ncbi:sterol carrier family protein [Frankia sp. Cr1]|uniref:sterol carrier family protein n=1 Tax=Frankia sp. Cr1 TaxID=3073931 RepID=UPI002AD35B06|nr:sterol carrier family protein [Frankia sp. Cr1]
MSAARRDDRKLVSAVVGQWERIAERAAVLAAQECARPSRLPGWSAADLVLHTAGSAAALAAALAGPPPPAADARPERLLSVESYLAAPAGLAGLGPRDDAPNGTAADTGTAAETRWGAGERGRLRSRLGDGIAAAVAGLAGVDPARPVMTAAGGMRLGDLLVALAVDGVVHGLDLGVDPHRDAVRIVVRTFTGLLVARAPGRCVEVRVPPFAAVQVVDGPRHTRGTPPNVVETDPVTFVDVAVGRLSWVDAAADGRVRASGSRADLRPYLPLL